MTSPVLAEALRPARAAAAVVYDVALIAGFSLLIGLSAQVAIPLPFTPVPITLQTLVVLVAGFLLGSWRGAVAVLAYLGEGLAGLPLFSTGTAGLAHLLGPTGGYILGFLLAAGVVGWLAERALSALPALRAPVAFLVGTVVIYLCGATWLGAFVGAAKAVSLGVLPFLAGDALKLLAAWGIVAALSQIRPRRTPVGRGSTPPGQG